MHFIEFLAFLLSAQSQVRAAQPVDLSNINSVKSALQSMAANLMNYEKQGKVKPVNSNGPEGFQWFEGGLYYGIMMDYTKITQDNQYSNTIVNSLTAASFGTTGSFLGSNPAASELGGKWNDDILWWSIPALTGAELYEKDTIMPGGVSYFNLADKTYQEAMGQWDNVCSGGIYWVRSQNRAGKNSFGQSFAYKSTITQSEAIVNAARLGILSGNQTYFAEADRIYKWMISSGLLTPSFDVLDGIDADGGKCTRANLVLSYQSGIAAGAFAWLTYGTKKPEYINMANSIFKKSLETFVENNIVFDPCEKGGQKCALNMAPHKGAMVRGWGMLYEFSTDDAIRTQIKQILQTTVSQMLKTCDAQWNCGDDWLGATPATGANIHYQMNAVELMNSYYKTFFSGPVGKGLSAPTQVGVSNGPPPPFTGAASFAGVSWGIVALAAAFSVLV